MWVKQIGIENVGGIGELSIHLDESVNIICGPNGVGKTTVLECIAHLFLAGPTKVLKSRAGSDSSVVYGTVVSDEREHAARVVVREFLPGRDSTIQGLHLLSSKLLSLKVHRTFEYRALDSVTRDADKPTSTVHMEASTGVKYGDVKNWFVNRYLYGPHGTLTSTQTENYQSARDSFQKLSPEFSFSRVDPATNEILVNSPTGEIYYEYLSSGFKSCLSVIFGIIKEIEFRFPASNVSAREFDGVVLIDEIELHLHPAWQKRILGVINSIFPRAQIICTTHSPHVVQAADSNQIIVLEGNDGRVSQRALPNSVAGYKGWTIEEILTDLMGMEDLSTPEFRSEMQLFERALDEDDRRSAEMAMESLVRMVHPASPMKKLFAMQLNALGESID